MAWRCVEPAPQSSSAPQALHWGTQPAVRPVNCLFSVHCNSLRGPLQQCGLTDRTSHSRILGQIQFKSKLVIISACSTVHTSMIFRVDVRHCTMKRWKSYRTREEKLVSRGSSSAWKWPRSQPLVANSMDVVTPSTKLWTSAMFLPALSSPRSAWTN